MSAFRPSQCQHFHRKLMCQHFRLCARFEAVCVVRPFSMICSWAFRESVCLYPVFSRGGPILFSNFDAPRADPQLVLILSITPSYPPSRFRASAFCAPSSRRVVVMRYRTHTHTHPAEHCPGPIVFLARRLGFDQCHSSKCRKNGRSRAKGLHCKFGSSVDRSFPMRAATLLGHARVCQLLAAAVGRRGLTTDGAERGPPAPSVCVGQFLSTAEYQTSRLGATIPERLGRRLRHANLSCVVLSLDAYRPIKLGFATES